MKDERVTQLLGCLGVFCMAVVTCPPKIRPVEM